MKLFSCGAADGRLVIYFHGAPGAPEECSLFDHYAQADGLTVVSLDRFAAEASLQGEGYFRALASEILACAGTGQVHFVGFSIGAFVALQTTRHMQGRVASLDLISAAAPLQVGNFLPDMAGQQVFLLAGKWPLLFRLLSTWQGWLARFAPGLLFRMLFASAQAVDRQLLASSQFRQQCIAQLRHCFVGQLPGYLRDVQSYVQPWSAGLGAIKTPTRIWHGAEDNWSPTAMAGYLGAALPGCEQVTILPGLSHYSCLQQVVPEVCAAIGAARG